MPATGRSARQLIQALTDRIRFGRFDVISPQAQAQAPPDPRVRKRRELSAVQNRTAKIVPSDILVFTTLRNELVRLPYFLKYYRDLGVNHFLIVDNGSDDGSREYLAQQDDVSLWTTQASYKRAKFGVDWLNWLQRKYGIITGA